MEARHAWTEPAAPPPRASLLTARAAELAALAGALRDRRRGRVVTYSPKVFLPLTQLCRDRCGYCTFARAPGRLAAPFLDPEEVLAIAEAGARAGATEALFTLGEAPEDRYPVARRWLEERGHASTLDYLEAMCALVLERTGLLPHANAGALDAAALGRLRRVSPSQGMMLETLAERLGAVGAPHGRAPDKTPDRRLATLEAAGHLAIPFTTGLLVGIGETRAERLDALAAIGASHARHGHVQEVIVQNFLPKPGTRMHDHPACDPEEHLWTIAAARLLLPPEVSVQAPPNLIDDPGPLLDAGIDDLGGISAVTPDHVNPERPWPAIERLAAACAERGFDLAPRLTVHPRYVRAPERWIDPELHFAVQLLSDATGHARADRWAAGGELPPPALASEPPARRGRPRDAVDEVLDGVAVGQETGEEQIVALFEARGDAFQRVCDVADELRRATVGDAVTYVRNRNINYTNVCTFRCAFCAFSKGPLAEDLRGRPYLMEVDEVARLAAEAVERGATEVCLQGGIHPEFDGRTYLDITRAVRAAAPSLHIHGFTALEVTEGARRLGVSLADFLRELAAEGLHTLPGTAAEILDDEVRAELCPDKVTTDEWLEAHRTAHSVGLRSNATIMFGHMERTRHWARHLLRVRALQRETGGFTELVPLPFVHMAAPIFRRRRARPGPTFREALLMHAVPRIALHGAIDHIQASWVKMGVEGARRALAAGADDLGGTLMDERISRAAGAKHGTEMSEASLAEIARAAGRPLARRTTLYATP